MQFSKEPDDLRLNMHKIKDAAAQSSPYKVNPGPFARNTPSTASPGMMASQRKSLDKLADELQQLIVDTP